MTSKTSQFQRKLSLFAADAKSMCTNIDTKIGVIAVREFLEGNKEKITHSFPSQIFFPNPQA